MKTTHIQTTDLKPGDILLFGRNSIRDVVVSVELPTLPGAATATVHVRRLSHGGVKSWFHSGVMAVHEAVKKPAA